MLALCSRQRGYSRETESLARDSASPDLTHSLHFPSPLTHL